MYPVLILLFFFVLTQAQTGEKVNLGVGTTLQIEAPFDIKVIRSDSAPFLKTPRALYLKDSDIQKIMFDQNMGNHINQIYYSTKIIFTFSEYFYIQSAKLVQYNNLQRSSRRHEGERVRLIFMGFDY